MGGVKDEKFQYYGGSLKNSIFRGGGVTKKQYIGRTVCRFKEEAWRKRGVGGGGGGGGFEGEVDTPMHTMTF